VVETGKRCLVSSHHAASSGPRIFLALILVGLSALFAAPPAGATIYQIPAGIRANCSADVTQDILSWIASVPDNSVLSFGSGDCYRIDGTLELTGRNGLTFEGNGARFDATTTGGNWRSQWRLVGGSHIVLRNMAVQGANPMGGMFVAQYQHQHGFDLVGVKDVEIDHTQISDVYGDCVYVTRGWDSAKAWSSNIHVHDSTCAGNGRMGIAVVAGRDIVVENSSFSQIARTAFDIEPNGAGFGAQNVTFRGNHVSGPLPGGFFTAIGDGPVESVAVTGNTLSGVGAYMAVLPPSGQRRSNITITDNVSDTGYYAPGSVALDLLRVDGLTVTGNTIPLSGPNMALADVAESCSVNVSQNTFPIGVVEARIVPYSSCSGSQAPPPHQPPSVELVAPVDGAPTLTSLSVNGQAGAGARSNGGTHTRRAHGRVTGSTSGRMLLRLERFARAKHRWVDVDTLALRLGHEGRFTTVLRGLASGAWRAKAMFLGGGRRAPSASRYRYFSVG
jgi:Right handed beta helix region